MFRIEDYVRLDLRFRIGEGIIVGQGVDDCLTEAGRIRFRGNGIFVLLLLVIVVRFLIIFGLRLALSCHIQPLI